MLDLVKVGGRHHDALEGVLRGEDDMLVAASSILEGDVGDLLVLAIHLTGVFVQGVHLHGLAEDVVLRAWANSLSRSANFLTISRGESRRGGGVELAEAGGVLRGGKMRRRRKSEGEQSAAAWRADSSVRNSVFRCGQTDSCTMLDAESMI